MTAFEQRGSCSGWQKGWREVAVDGEFFLYYITADADEDDTMDLTSHTLGDNKEVAGGAMLSSKAIELQSRPPDGRASV